MEDRQVNHIGGAFVPPWGDKGFRDFKNADPRQFFCKPNFGSPAEYKMEIL